ncbi:SDR family NAD(P)-dependent oxidoreductase [Burkholderia sp. Bp9143]|uniref:SDR family NAD(P)-dependent oxidoreductase n=1 Tax=Burkholderia sp. Bp9143 TaxID=2184574 RepID=UPI000F5A53F4|nr:SDR family NAD(P)-dependent oxidoreductase [Burkholderia sp. Bp9143]RQR24985.1 SDR family NAD(P)-dependent oxidoreductase [Burkholderia sp. Bp9143]
MRIALVTGAGRRQGLGFETARQLAHLGFHVFVTARIGKKAEEYAQELQDSGLKVSALQLDTTDGDSVARAVAAVTEKFGKLDVLVNNAAIMAVTPVQDFRTDLDAVRQQFETNLLGTWRMSQEFFPLLCASGDARIVNVSSGAGAFWDPDFGLVNNPGFEMSQFGDVPIGSYALTKLAINGLTLKLAQDFKAHQILVNSVCPGLVATYPGSPVSNAFEI